MCPYFHRISLGSFGVCLVKCQFRAVGERRKGGLPGDLVLRHTSLNDRGPQAAIADKVQKGGAVDGERRAQHVDRSFDTHVDRGSALGDSPQRCARKYRTMGSEVLESRPSSPASASYDDADRRRSASPSLVDGGGTDDRWKVKKILKSRVRRNYREGRIEYLVA
ncbi:hypothetical protein McanMca71_005091 [Microsporum canis]